MAKDVDGSKGDTPVPPDDVLSLKAVIAAALGVLEGAINDLVAAGASNLADREGLVKVDSARLRRALDSLNDEYVRLRKI